MLDMHDSKSLLYTKHLVSEYVHFFWGGGGLNVTLGNFYQMVTQNKLRKCEGYPVLFLLFFYFL